MAGRKPIQIRRNGFPLTVADCNDGDEFFLLETAIWRDNKHNIWVGSFNSCFPVHYKLNKSCQRFLWAKCRQIEYKDGVENVLNVVYNGNYEDLVELDIQSQSKIRVTKFGVLSSLNNDRIRNLMTNSLRCELCSINPQERYDLCTQCNNYVSFFLGNVFRKNKCKFLVKDIRTKIIKNLRKELNNAP